jgi:hypothetical protein
VNLALPVATETAAAVMVKPQEPPTAPAGKGAPAKEGFRNVLKAVGESHKEVVRKGGEAGSEKLRRDDAAGVTAGSPVPLSIGNSAREALFGWALPRPETDDIGSETAPAPKSSGQEDRPRVEASGVTPAVVSGARPPLPANVTLAPFTLDLKGAKSAEPAAPQRQAPVAFAIRLSAASAPARPVVSPGIRTQQRTPMNEREELNLARVDDSAAGPTGENLSEKGPPQPEQSPALMARGGGILPNVAERDGTSRESTQPEVGAALPNERSSPSAPDQTAAIHAPEASELKKAKPAQTEAGTGKDSNQASTADRRSPASAPAASPTLSRTETMGPRQDERPLETSAQETHESKRVASPPEQTPAPATREISFRLAGPESSAVDVKLIDRAGKVHVAVRSADGELAHTLRGDLPELIGRLEQRGFSAETWTPAEHSTIAAHASEGARHETPGNGAHSQDSPGGQTAGDRGEGRRQPQRPRWMDELERNAAPEAGLREETE